MTESDSKKIKVSTSSSDNKLIVKGNESSDESDPHQEEPDHLSSQLEKQLGKLPLYLHLFFYTLAAFILALIIWAWQAPLDVVSQAVGEVSPSGKVQIVQHLEGGIVKHILVKEGDMVEAEQPLINLDTTNQQASLNELDKRLSYLMVTRWRLLNELDEDNVDMSPPPEGMSLDNENNLALLREARLLYRERLKNLQESIDVQDKAVTQRQQGKAEEAIRIRRLIERRRLLSEQVDISEELINEDLSNRYEHIELLKQLNSIDSAIESGETALLRLETALEQSNSEKQQLISQFRSVTRDELKETNQELVELTERRKKLSDSLDRTVLTAPLAGIIKRIYPATEGGVISPGAPVLEIVPRDDGVFIRAKLPPQDIGYVKVGQEATLRLTSPDAPLFGYITGNVTFVSPDTIIDENKQPFYSVHIESENIAFESNNNVYPLFPGMVLSVGINTGKRTVMQYILSPFSQSLSFALSER